MQLIFVVMYLIMLSSIYSEDFLKLTGFVYFFSCCKKFIFRIFTDLLFTGNLKVAFFVFFQKKHLFKK